MQQEKELVSKQKEIEDVISKVKSLKDPDSFEAAISKLDQEIDEMENIREKQREYNDARRRAVQNEFNAALNFVAENKQFREKKLDELNSHVDQANSNLGDLAFNSNE